MRAGLTQGTSPELTDPLGTVLRVHDICRTHGNVLIFFFFVIRRNNEYNPAWIIFVLYQCSH